MEQSRARLDWIDSLRGIAAIMVAILHLWLLMRPSVTASNPALANALSIGVSDFLDFGKIGVVVFFLISGYVIPYSLYKASAKNFVISRFFRLYPAYWVAIISSCIIVTMPGVKQLLANITMFQKTIGVEDMVGVFWTLQIELIFYIMCLVLHHFKLLNNDKFLIRLFYILLGVTLIIAFLRFTMGKKLPVALTLGLTVMILGMLWRKNTLESSAIVTVKVFYQLIIALVVVLLPITLLAYTINYGNNENWYKYFISYILALLMFKAFAYYKPSGKILVFLGTISYSLYLLHPIFGMELPFKLYDKAYYDGHPLVFIAFFCVFSVAAAWLCYNLVEKPCIRQGKKLTNITNKQKENTVI